jgi:hypothetical protein
MTDGLALTTKTNEDLKQVIFGSARNRASMNVETASLETFMLTLLIECRRECWLPSCRGNMTLRSVG